MSIVFLSVGRQSGGRDFERNLGINEYLLELVNDNPVLYDALLVLLIID